MSFKELGASLKLIQLARNKELLNLEEFFGGIDEIRELILSITGLSRDELVVSEENIERLHSKEPASGYGPVRREILKNKCVISLKSENNGQARVVLELLPVGGDKILPPVFASKEKADAWEKENFNTFNIRKDQLPEDPKLIIEELSKIPFLVGSGEEVIPMLKKLFKDTNALDVAERSSSDRGGGGATAEYKTLVFTLSGRDFLTIHPDFGVYKVDISELNQKLVQFL